MAKELKQISKTWKCRYCEANPCTLKLKKAVTEPKKESKEESKQTEPSQPQRQIPQQEPQEYKEPVGEQPVRKVENETTFDEIKKKYESEGGTPITMENIKVKAYRVGEVKESFDRGIFFASDKESAEKYVSLHPGYSVKEYTIELPKVLVTGHQNSLCKLFFNKSYMDMMYNLGGEVEGGRKLDKKIKHEIIKRKLDGIIYTRPAPPAKMEVMIIDSKYAVEYKEPEAGNPAGSEQ